MNNQCIINIPDHSKRVFPEKLMKGIEYWLLISLINRLTLDYTGFKLSPHNFTSQVYSGMENYKKLNGEDI